MAANNAFNPGSGAAIRRNRPVVNAKEPVAATAREPETVEQFLARGGLIEKLDVSASSRTPVLTQREVNQAAWDRRTVAMDADRSNAQAKSK